MLMGRRFVFEWVLLRSWLIRDTPQSIQTCGTNVCFVNLSTDMLYNRPTPEKEPVKIIDLNPILMIFIPMIGIKVWQDLCESCRFTLNLNWTGDAVNVSQTKGHSHRSRKHFRATYMSENVSFIKQSLTLTDPHQGIHPPWRLKVKQHISESAQVISSTF